VLHLNKVIIPLAAGLLLSSSAAALAPDTPKTELSTAKLRFNYETNSMFKGPKVYQINGSTYAPVRWLVEQTRGSIHYDETSRVIDIQYPKRYVQSKVSSSNQNSDFKLKLHSEKKTYSAGEYPNIWATLEYKSDGEKTIFHGIPLLSFVLVDDQGNTAPAYTLTKREQSLFKKDTDLYASLSPHTIQNYNLERLQLKPTTPEEWDNVPSVLPSGRYYISAMIHYSESEKPAPPQYLSLVTELEFEVK
jgi:hypothetical protein